MMERHVADNSPHARPLWLHQCSCRYGRPWRKAFTPRLAIVRQTVFRVRRAKQGGSHALEQAARADYSRRLPAQITRAGCPHRLSRRRRTPETGPPLGPQLGPLFGPLFGQQLVQKLGL